MSLQCNAYHPVVLLDLEVDNEIMGCCTRRDEEIVLNFEDHQCWLAFITKVLSTCTGCLILLTTVLVIVFLQFLVKYAYVVPTVLFLWANT